MAYRVKIFPDTEGNYRTGWSSTELEAEINTFLKTIPDGSLVSISYNSAFAINAFSNSSKLFQSAIVVYKI
ncbi:MAG: sporulation protein Cse60 [Firmicutes bacterium]|nr:sporulation protein Cse60 [Bacillota bacterium]